ARGSLRLDRESAYFLPPPVLLRTPELPRRHKRRTRDALAVRGASTLRKAQRPQKTTARMYEPATSGRMRTRRARESAHLRHEAREAFRQNDDETPVRFPRAPVEEPPRVAGRSCVTPYSAVRLRFVPSARFPARRSSS